MSRFSLSARNKIVEVFELAPTFLNHLSPVELGTHEYVGCGGFPVFISFNRIEEQERKPRKFQGIGPKTTPVTK